MDYLTRFIEADPPLAFTLCSHSYHTSVILPGYP